MSDVTALPVEEANRLLHHAKGIRCSSSWMLSPADVVAMVTGQGFAIDRTLGT
jgi:hypothetical protein